MKMRYYIENSEKTYTLKEEHNSLPTKSAHYKFVKIKSEEEKRKH